MRLRRGLTSTRYLAPRIGVLLMSTVLTTGWSQLAGRIAPGPVVVQLLSASGEAPVAGATVRIGGRFQTTGPDGRATFDGIPAGSYRLVVEPNGWERHEQTVVLPPGRRDPVELRVQAVSPAVVPVEVRCAEDNRPVAGAELSLKPVSVAAAVQGSWQSSSDWDGKCQVCAVPAGTYRLAASAPGCTPVTLSVDVKPDMAPVTVHLPRETDDLALRLRVRDAVSGTALAGAHVQLCEAWPIGRIAEGQTGADGVLFLAGLKRSQLNWMAGDGALAWCRRNATVRVESDGYAPMCVPVSLSPACALDVALNPRTVIEEREPNDTVDQAQLVRVGAPVRLMHTDGADWDYVRFRLPYAAQVRIEVAAHPALDTYMRVCSATGQEIWNRGVNRNEPDVLTGGLPAGEYLVGVTDGWNNDRSPEPLTLTISADYAPDAMEPNDTQDKARLWQVGEELRGTIFPVRDVDWFRFQITRPGRVRIVAVPNVNLALSILVRREDVIAAGWHEFNPADPAPLAFDVSPGWYEVEIHDAWDNEESLTPYTFRLEEIQDDGIDDSVRTSGKVDSFRPLALQTLVGSTIWPVRDSDHYSVPIPGPGRLSVYYRGPLWGWVGIFDDRLQLLTSVAGGTEKVVSCSREYDGPTTAYLAVHDEWDNEASPWSYTLWTSWEPSDETDFAARNDTYDNATPLLPVEETHASIAPTRDVDLYRIEVEQPGTLQVTVNGPLGYWMRLENAKHEDLTSGAFPPGTEGILAREVLPGEYFLRVHDEWDNEMNPGHYRLSTRFSPAEPGESVPLRDRPLRTLTAGVGQSFRIDQVGDSDRFLLNVAEAGKFTVRIRGQRELWVDIVENLGLERPWEQRRVFAREFPAPTDATIELEAKGPMQYMVHVEDPWSNESYPNPHFILFDPMGRDVPSALVSGICDPLDPTLVTFRCEVPEGLCGADNVSVDANADGSEDLQVPVDGTATWRYPAEGTYHAVAWLRKDTGVRSRLDFWVTATGPRERKGIYLIVNYPTEGQTILRSEPIRATAISYSGARVTRIGGDVDGTPLPTSYSAPFQVEAPWATMGPGEHVLTLTVTDARGEQSTVTRKFRVSEYLDLLPADGATVTGNQVRVTWNAGRFGPSVVRYRAKGEEQWHNAMGDAGRVRTVILSDLEAGKAYEFQPLGGTEEPPIRTVTRVKGLAFGRSRYGATINRDYDQRVPISVRNHGDNPLTVKLVCGRPDDPDMLVGFVGEGSEGAPFTLNSGEEREFLLCFSAQDVTRPHTTLPIRIVSDNGYSDEAEVAVDVKLPTVKLRWEDLGETLQGMGRRLRLINEGDGLTDLAISSSSPDLTVSPSITHGTLPAGQWVDVSALPRLYEGFRGVKGQVVATAVGQQTIHDLDIALKEGQQIFGVDLAPRDPADRETDPDEALLQQARRMSAAYLSPDYLDWSRGQNPQDMNGDGRPDRWDLSDTAENTYWVGDDTNGDGQVDFVHGDVGDDGQFDYSAIRGQNGWEETNVVEAWLEMGFTLPWSRNQYEKHDVDVVMNGTVVGKLRDQVPEGNYAFRVPPTALAWNEGGTPGANEVEIQSKHLRGGHYVVSSDFRMKVRTTGTRVWAVAGSEEEARKVAAETPGLVLAAPDYSVSSAEVSLQPTTDLRAGAQVSVTVPVRNVGALTTSDVVVALRAGEPGAEGIEVDRQVLENVPLGTSVPVTLTWTAAAGQQGLKIVVDPDKELQDPDLTNNIAVVNVTVGGDTAKPTLRVLEPAEGGRIDGTVVPLRAQAADDGAVARVEASIDGALPTALAPAGGEYSSRVLLQPGPHRILFRAVDGCGNAVESTVTVTTDAPTPTVSVQGLADGAVINERTTPVHFQVSPDTTLAAVRVNSGPWQRASIKDGVASVTVPLSFGKAAVEAMAANAHGAIKTQTISVECTKLATEGDAPSTVGPGTGVGTGGVVDVPGFGPVDLFAAPNFVQPPAGGPANAGGPAGFTPDPAEAAEAEQEEALPPLEFDESTWADLEDEDSVPLDDEDASVEPEDFSALAVEPDDVATPPAIPEGTAANMDWNCMVGPRAGQDPSKPDGGTGGGCGGCGHGCCGPKGGFVTVQARQNDWYCTNRPNVKVRFQLPDWLRKKDLSKYKPGSKEYNDMVAKLLEQLKRQGIDTGPFERFQQALLRKARGLQGPDELPGFLESLGLSGPAPKDEAGLKAWREKMEAGVQAWYLRLLSSGDPALIAAGLKARGEAFGQFDEALQLSAQAAIETIKANQKLTEEVMYSLPYVGATMDLMYLGGKLTGSQLLGGGQTLSGDEVTWTRLAVTGLFRMGPLGVQKALQTKNGARFMAYIGEKTAWMPAAALNRFSNAIGADPNQVRQGLKWVWEGLTKERQLWGSGVSRQVTQAGTRFANSPAGRSAQWRLVTDIRRAEKLVGKLQSAAGNRQEFRKLVLELQRNKTAQSVINSARFPDALRVQVNKTLKAYSRLADRRTIQGIVNSAQGRQAMEKLANKAGVRVEDITVRARTISGNTGARVGRDRDVWFEFITRDGKKLSDVHHDISGPIYNQEIRRITGMTAQELDHTVTSVWHPEAYNTGRLNPQDLVKGQMAGKLPRPEDVRDTIIHKADHWFEQARTLEAGGKLTHLEQAEVARLYTEGMRQVLKEYERHLAPLMGKGVNLPPRLQQGLDIFRQVQQGLQTGEFTVAQAQAMLGKMGCSSGTGAALKVTPDVIAQDLGYFVEYINKWGPNGQRWTLLNPAYPSAVSVGTEAAGGAEGP